MSYADDLNELLRKERLKNKKKRRATEHMEHRQNSTGTGFHRDKTKYTRKRKHKNEEE